MNDNLIAPVRRRTETAKNDRQLSVAQNRDVATDDRQGNEASVSVIMALRDPERVAPLQQLYADYKEQIEKIGLPYEFVIVIDGDHDALYEQALLIKDSGENVKIVKLAQSYGDATALSAGFEQASGSLLLTLPAYHQIEPNAIPSLFDALEKSDMVAVRRWPRIDGWRNEVKTRTFHYILKKLVGVEFNDLTCGVRLFRKEILDSVHVYGDQHRFFSVLVSRFGFKVREVAVPQVEREAYHNRHSVGTNVRRILDLISIFFLVKFTKKPLRFFGLTGLAVFTAGAAFSLFLAAQRIYMGVPLADRPALLLGLLFIVLGIQLFAIGIIGELIIFSHAKEVREYTIETVIN